MKINFAGVGQKLVAQKSLLLAIFDLRRLMKTEGGSH